MKTKEFIKTLQDKNYCVEVADDNGICVRLSDGSVIALISGEYTDVFTIGIHVSRIEDENERTWLIYLITCFAKTPIDERDGKKYYLKHRWLICNGLEYLCYDKGSYIYFLSERPLVEDDDATSEFTQEHINSIKKKFDTSLEDFEMIEVQNED